MFQFDYQAYYFLCRLRRPIAAVQNTKLGNGAGPSNRPPACRPKKALDLMASSCVTRPVHLGVNVVPVQPVPFGVAWI